MVSIFGPIPNNIVHVEHSIDFENCSRFNIF